VRELVEGVNKYKDVIGSNRQYDENGHKAENVERLDVEEKSVNDEPEREAHYDVKHPTDRQAA